MSDWISVDERLPEINDGGYVHSKFYGVREGVRDCIPNAWAILVNNEQITIVGDVTHWQPKTYPKPPETELPNNGKACFNCKFWEGERKHNRWNTCAVRTGCIAICQSTCFCNKWELVQVCGNCQYWRSTELCNDLGCGRCLKMKAPTSAIAPACDDWKAKESEPEIIKIGKILIDTSDVETMKKIRRLFDLATVTIP